MPYQVCCVRESFSGRLPRLSCFLSYVLPKRSYIIPGFLILLGQSVSEGVPDSLGSHGGNSAQLTGEPIASPSDALRPGQPFTVRLRYSHRVDRSLLQRSPQIGLK